MSRLLILSPESHAGLGGAAERYVPRPYALAAALRVLAPRLVRRVLAGGAAEAMTTTTGGDLADRRNGHGGGSGAGADSGAGPDATAG